MPCTPESKVAVDNIRISEGLAHKERLVSVFAGYGTIETPATGHGHKVRRGLDAGDDEA